MRGLVNLLRLLRTQWHDRRRVEELRDRNLRRLVLHAYRRVPYYRRLLDGAGVRPEEIRGAGDLARLPLTSKRDLQDLPPEEVVAAGTDPADVLSLRTSGATGVPLAIRTGRADRSLLNPSFIRVYLAWGLRPHQRLMFFEARPEAGESRSWYERLGILRRRVLGAGDEPDRWLAGLRAWRPHLLQGYSLTLKLLAEAALGRGARDIRIPLIISTSGVIDPRGRSLLAEAFGARVVDVYASMEAGAVMAWECPACGAYHVDSDNVVVEFLHQDGRPAAPGEEAEIVVTSLVHRTMPFIRYRQGDLGVFSGREPACGRGLPLMEKVLGRSDDCIVLPGGRRLSPHPFFVALDEMAGVGEWRITQERTGDLTVEVAAAQLFTGDVSGEVLRRLRHLVGGGVTVNVAQVESIRRDPSRKLRSIVSLVCS